MRLTCSDTCYCRRPIDSGRVILGLSVCRLCGLFMAPAGERAALKREQTERERMERQSNRVRAIGGLYPDGKSSQDHKSAGMPNTRPGLMSSDQHPHRDFTRGAE